MQLLKPWSYVCAAAAALMFSCSSIAAPYPVKPVTVIVGFAPGGTNDILARLIASELEKKLGKPFVVENKPGASSMISANYVKNAKPDGYTLLVISSGGLTVNSAVYSEKRVTYDPVKDFEPIAQLATFPLVVVTGPKIKNIESVEQLVAYAKENKDAPPTHGVATSSFQLAAELFAGTAGIKFTHVPYKGSGPVIADLMGGQTDLAFLDSAAVVPSVEAGRLKALAVTTTKRSPAMPDVPTIAESGWPDYDVPIWSGFVAPANTPKAIIDTLDGALKDILSDPGIEKRFLELGMEPGVADSQKFGDIIKSDLARWTKVAKDAGIQIE